MYCPRTYAVRAERFRWRTRQRCSLHSKHAREPDPLQLAGRAFGHVVAEHDLTWNFVCREAHSGEVAQLPFRCGEPCAKHDHGCDIFAELLVAHGEGDALC